MDAFCRYAIGGDKDDWAAAQAKVASRSGAASTSVISIKNPASTKRKMQEERKEGKKDKGAKDKKRKKAKHEA